MLALTEKEISKCSYLNGWLTPDCKFFEIEISHQEILYDKTIKIPAPLDKIDPGTDYLIEKHGYIKFNWQIYGICYNEFRITEKQIEWMENHISNITKLQKEVLKEIKEIRYEKQ